MSRRISVGMAGLNDMPHVLYRWFDASDVLLYVGITMDLPKRSKQHRSGKPWWTAAAYTTYEHFATRAEAKAAETRAIKDEKPLYNDAENVYVEVPISSEPPCGEDCDDDCKAHHGARWNCSGRSDLAGAIHDLLGMDIGRDLCTAGAARAAEQLELDRHERDWTGVTDPLVLTALYMTSTVAEEYATLLRVARRVLEAVPQEVRQAVAAGVDHDIECSGEPVSSERERTAHEIRHLGRELRHYFRTHVIEPVVVDEAEIDRLVDVWCGGPLVEEGSA